MILTIISLWILMYFITNFITSDKTVVDANAYATLDHDKSPGVLAGWHRRILILNLLVWPWVIQHYLSNSSFYRQERFMITLNKS